MKREKRRLLNPKWFDRKPKLKPNKPKQFREKIVYQNGTKERDLIKRYNLQWEEYQNLLKKCNSLCPICGKSETRKRKNGTIYPLSIDHDHKTGKVRGILCNKCNACLGLINDNPIILQKMIEYLKNSL